MKTSADISTKSPLSVTGFSTRWLRVTRAHSPVGTALLFIPRWTVWLIGVLVLIAWNLLAWVLFFWFTLPWRAYRNSRRRDKKRAAEHQELLAALNNKTSDQ